MDIGRELAQIRAKLTEIERASRLSSASLDDTALEVRDGTGSLRGILGQQGDGTTAVNIVNGGPPPAPATPTAAPALGGVSVGWDGTFANGAIIPMDWARVEVHASPTAAFTATPDTLTATIETAQGGIVYIPSTVPLYVQLLARNTSGAASPATTEVGPYAPKPVAGEIGIGEITETMIGDGAVTTPKVYANAITTALLAAGSVDAVALKADAITGKTITGGIINGAEIHSDDGAGGLVDIQNGNVVATGPSNWKALIDTEGFTPAIGFLDSTGATAGAIYGSGNDALPNLRFASGTFADGGIPDWHWVTSMGATSGGNRVWTRRERYSNAAYYRGGEVMADDDAARISYLDSEAPASNTFLTVFLGHAQLAGGRLSVSSPASSNSSLYVNAATGHTGPLIRAQLNAVERFAVTTAGGITGASLDVTGNVTAGNIRSGRVTFAPSAANTPTSATVTGLAMSGSNPRAVATASTTVPGTQMLGVGCTNVTSDSVTIWLTRTNTSSTGIDYIVIAS